MKKFAACFIAVALIISSAFAQESLRFQMQYKPQTKYTQAIGQLVLARWSLMQQTAFSLTTRSIWM